MPDDGSVFWCGQRHRAALSAPHSFQAMSAFKLSIALSALLVATAAAQTTVDDVVAKNLAAKGGIEKLRAITTVKMTGSLKSPSGVTAITTWAKRPSFMRRDNVNDGQTFVTAFDGKTLWQINPLISPRPRDIPAASETRQTPTTSTACCSTTRQKGRTVELVGTEPVQGINMHRLRVTEKNGQIRDIYINAETMLESKAVCRSSRAAARRSSRPNSRTTRRLTDLDADARPADVQRQADDRSHLRPCRVQRPDPRFDVLHAGSVAAGPFRRLLLDVILYIPRPSRSCSFSR